MSRNCDTQVLLKGNSIVGRPKRKGVVFVLDNKPSRNEKTPVSEEPAVQQDSSIAVHVSCIPSPLPPIPGAITDTTDYVLKHNPINNPVQLWRSASVTSNNAEDQERGVLHPDNRPESSRRISSSTRKIVRRTNAIYIKRVPSDSSAVDSWVDEHLWPLPLQNGFSPEQMSNQCRISSAGSHDVSLSRRHTFQNGRSRDTLAGDIEIDGRPPGRRGRIKRTTSALMRPGCTVAFPDPKQPVESPEQRKNNTPVTPPPTNNTDTATSAAAVTRQKLQAFRKKRLNVTPESTMISQGMQADSEAPEETGGPNQPKSEHFVQNDGHGRCSRSNAVARSPSRITSAKELSRMHRLALQNNTSHGDVTCSTTHAPRERSALRRSGSSRIRPDIVTANIVSNPCNVKPLESPKARPDTVNVITDSGEVAQIHIFQRHC
jgi:hypothetical protein